MISIEKMIVQFGGFELFKDISFMINPKDRIGLVGKNGAGKSTLLKCIVGEISPDKGRVSYPQDFKMGYLPQQMIYPKGRTVFDEALTAFEEVRKLERQIESLTKAMNERTDYESDGYMKLIHQLTESNERYDLLGGQTTEADTEQILIGLGFERKDFHRQSTEFSGGWKMRIELAKVLLRRPNTLLLDEPTNHLDIESIQWLEGFLRNYEGAVLLISHDRKFLDTITNRTIEISMGRAYDYRVPYTKYVQLRQERHEQQLAAYENQQRMIQDIERFIERFRYKASKAVQVQSRVKQLEKLERIEIDAQDTSSLHFRFPPAPRSGNLVIETVGLSKSYGEKKVLEDVDLIIERGEKIAFVGRNGEGKTTLSRIILNELDYTGNYKLGHQVSIGYFAQNQDELMDDNKTVFEILDDIAVGEVRKNVRNILASFLFGGEDIDKKVSVLSGGERSRLAMAKLLLQPYSLLVLDEPTNHLDIRSKDILKQALNQYEGTLIIVSHDRDFLEGLASKVYEFKNRNLKEYLGGIEEFLRKKKIDNVQEIERKDAILKEKTVNNSTNKQLFAQRKEAEKRIRKAQRELEKNEKEIELLETKIKEANLLLSQPEHLEDQNLYHDYEEYKKQLEQKMEQWELLNDKLEKQVARKNKIKNS